MLRYYSNIKLLHILSAVVQHILLRQMHLLLPSSVLCIAAKSSCKLRVMKLKKTYLVEAVKYCLIEVSSLLRIRFYTCSSFGVFYVFEGYTLGCLLVKELC